MSHKDAWKGLGSTEHTQNKPSPGIVTISTPPPTFPLPSTHSSMFSLIRSLLLTTAPPPAEQPGVPIQPHSFIEKLHVPRIYKTYLQELSDVCRDYFWVFCHPQNSIWSLADTDEAKVETPRAPGGMTGGVEYEAVGYMVAVSILFTVILDTYPGHVCCIDLAFASYQLRCKGRYRARLTSI